MMKKQTDTSAQKETIILLCFVFCFLSGLHAESSSYSFLTKAQQYFKSEFPKPETFGTPKIHEIDSVLKNAGSLSFDQSCSVSWAVGYLLLEKGLHFKALEIFIEIRNHLEQMTSLKEDDFKKIASVYNVIGAIYEETGLWNEAMGLYMKSLQTCDLIGYDIGKAKVYNNLAKLYYSRNNFDKAEKLFLKAVEINKKLNIKQELFNNYNNLAGIYQQTEKYDIALEFAFMALNQLDMNNDPYNLSVIYSNIGILYQRKGNLEVALSYQQLARYYANVSLLSHPLINAYLSISSTYKDMKQMAMASEYMDLALKESISIDNPPQKLIVLKYAADFYKERGDYQLAAQYYSNYSQLNDSLTSLNSLIKIEQVQSVYDVIKSEKDNQILQQKLSLQDLAIQRQRIILAAIIFALLLISYVIVYLQKARKRERTQNQQLARQAELLHQKEKQVLVSNENSLKLELDYKNRQLTYFALQMARNNEFVLNVSSGLKQISYNGHLKEKEKNHIISEMLAQINQVSNGNDWEEFRLYFQEVHQSFEKNLSTAYPDLSPNDKKICALLRLGLSTKDIASITFREIRSVESARNRLRKKLCLLPEVNITNFLSQF